MDWDRIVVLDKTSSVPLYRQVYESLRSGIEAEVLPAHMKLPALRELAKELHVARNTIEAAYAQLVSEGYVRSRHGYGFFVEELDFHTAETDVDEGAPPAKSRAEHAHSRATMARVVTEYDASGGCYFNFSYGNRTSGSFPIEQWMACAQDAMVDAQHGELDSYTEEFGVWGLRVAIAHRLKETRGVRCEPEQVVIVPGTQAAVSSVISLFDHDQRTVCMEDPGYYAARSMFALRDCTVLPVPTHEGPASFVEALRKQHARLLWLTPSNQFPLGYILPLKERLKVIDWAVRENAYIIEDDYCCEYRYNLQSVPSMQSLDTSGHVIYLGTMSKILSPALRISYLVLPPALVDRWFERSVDATSSVPWITQRTLELFMTKGKWNTYVRRTVNLYRHRHELLMDTLHRTLGKRVELMGADAGQHLLVGVKDGRSACELIKLAKSQSVRVYGLDQCWMDSPHPMDNYVLLGFSSIQDELIPEGIERLKRAWF